MEEFNIQAAYANNTLDMIWEGRLRADNVSTVFDILKQYPDAINFIIDAKDLEYVASAGLGALLAVIKASREKSGEVTLKNVSKLVTELLELTGYDRMVKCE